MAGGNKSLRVGSSGGEEGMRAGNEERMPGMSMFIHSSIQPEAAHHSSAGIKAAAAAASDSERL